MWVGGRFRWEAHVPSVIRRCAIAALIWAALPAAASADADADLERGLARFQAGEFSAAIDPLMAAHAADPSDLDTALLLGIAYYRCGDAARARPLLVAAARSPDPETRDSARIFLGLVADAGGDADEALGYYSSVARGSSSLATSGRELFDRGRGKWFSAGLVLRPELDSNVALLPASAASAGGSTADRDLFMLADLHLRLFDELGLVLDETLAYRKQDQLTDFDMASSVSGLTWGHRGAMYRAALGYHVETSMLGGERYQLGQTVDAGGRRAIAGSFGVAASYQLAVRTLYPDAYAGYTGTTQTGTARLSWLAPAWELELGAVIAREATDDPTLSALATGGQLAARLQLGRVDLRMFMRGTDRRYDDAAQGRRDFLLQASASLYVDLTPHLGAVLGGGLLDNHSDVMDDSYVKWTGYLGIVVATAP
jgi:tetratricopeptide (TPR) repeat protein